jgi:hypothetical protein
LLQIAFPETLKTICNSAFARCTRLADITLNPRLAVIESCAFAQTAVRDVTFPASLSRIEQFSFFGCRQLSRVQFRNNARTVVGHSAFMETALQAVTLPAGGCMDPDVAFPLGCTIQRQSWIPCLLSDYCISSRNASDWSVVPITSTDPCQRPFFRFVEDWTRIAGPWTAEFRGFTMPSADNPGTLVFETLPGKSLSEVMEEGTWGTIGKVTAVIAIVRLLMWIETLTLNYGNYWPTELRFDEDVLKAQWMAPAKRPACRMFAAVTQRIIDGGSFPAPEEDVSPGEDGLCTLLWEKCQNEVTFSQIWDILRDHEFSLIGGVDVAAVEAFVARVEALALTDPQRLRPLSGS